MKVLHVVTLVADGGAFGGPLTVAMNQAEELSRRGHDVAIAAGWQGEGPAPMWLQGTRAWLFPAYRAAPTGFSGLWSPGLLRWLTAKAQDFDLLHIHAGRDLITLPAMLISLFQGIPYVVQTHGMIGIDRKASARALDTMLTRRLLSGASRHLVITDDEERQLRQVQPSIFTMKIRNGLRARMSEPRLGAPSAEVLFCARLHVRKRPSAFVEMAYLVHATDPRLTFTIVGPDEGELETVRTLIQHLDLADCLRYEGALPHDDVYDRMCQASVYVLPSVDEPFPMSMLEALSAGMPCVCTSSCTIAGALAAAGAAIVTDGSARALADAVLAITAKSASYAAMSRAAISVTAELYSISAVVDDLEAVYQEAVNGAGKTHWYGA